MPAYIYVNPDGVNGSGASPTDSRRTWPTSIGAADTILLRAGTRLISTSQLTLGAGSDVVVSRYGPLADADPIIQVNAANFGSINIDKAGTNVFDHIHFDGMTGAVNGGAIVASKVGAGAAAVVHFYNCTFTNLQRNAIRLNGIGADAPATFRCINCTFDNIGEDAIYGGAIDYEVTDCTMTRLSQQSDTGDGIGYIDATPTRVYIARNFIDKSIGGDYKQCVIIDTLAPTGSCIIEDNEFIGYGDENTQAIVHTILIIQMPATVRRNKFTAAGLVYGFVGTGCQFYSNVVKIKNARINAPVIAMTDNNGEVSNNVFIATKNLESEQKIVTQNLSSTGNVCYNNIFVNVPIALASDNVGANFTATNNCFWNVRQQRRDANGVSFAGGNDITQDPLFINEAEPWDGLQAATPCQDAGLYRAGLRDFYDKPFRRINIGPWANIEYIRT